MRQLILSPEAVTDLAAIGRYSRRIWGVEQARRYSFRLADRMIKLKYRQRPGRPRPDIDETLRSLKSDSHVIFFYLEDNQIIVVRILHESMSPAPRIAVGLSSLALRGE